MPGSGWESALRIENNPEEGRRPQIALDGQGNAIALWQDLPSGNIWSNRYALGSGWGTAALVDDSDGPADSAQIAMNPRGNAIAVWHQFDGTRDAIRARRYVPGSGWAAVEPIGDDGAHDAHLPQIAIDSAGNAIAVWQQSDGTRRDIRANRFVAASGWQGPIWLEHAEADANAADIALAADGDAIAVWRQLGSASYDVWSNRFE